MAKYLFQGSYTEEGLKGLLKEGGTKRREAIEQAVKAQDGKVEAFYYAFGDNDFYLIVDYPSNIEASVTALMAGSAGTSTIKTTVLITPKEVDEVVEKAGKLAGTYRPPGR